MTLAIDVRGLNKSFAGKHVVQDVSIQVEEGRITGFLGPQRLGQDHDAADAMRPADARQRRGRGAGDGLPHPRRAIKRQTGYMTQRFSLYEDLTIRENLDFIARVYDLDRRRARVDEALEGLGLTNRQHQLSGALSGGWKQRLALAACILHEPRLLLLDEPTAGVDPKARRDFWDQIHALSARGLTVLVSTHYMDEAERCHDIAYIVYGRLIARGTSEEVVRQSGLITFLGEGQGADRLSMELAGKPGVVTAASFGQAVHVSGEDRAALEAAIAPYRREPYTWREVEPTMEDVFIRLMGEGQDNYG